MEQSVEVRYYRRPFLNSLIVCLLNLSILGILVFRSCTDSTLFGDSLRLDFRSVVIISLLVVLAVCSLLYANAKTLRDIKVCDGKLKITRYLGRVITADFHNVSMRNDTLYIGSFFFVQLSGLANKTEIKVMLCEHVKTYKTDKSLIHYLSFGCTILAIAAILLSVIILWVAGEKVGIWCLFGISATITALFFAWTAWNIAVK